MIQDNEFDYNAQDIDAFCTSHDIDDYDLFGEIMVGDDANYDELKKGNTVKIAGVLDDYSDNKQGININMINGTRK